MKKKILLVILTLMLVLSAFATIGADNEYNKKGDLLIICYWQSCVRLGRFKPGSLPYAQTVCIVNFTEDNHMVGFCRDTRTPR